MAQELELDLDLDDAQPAKPATPPKTNPQPVASTQTTVPNPKPVPPSPPTGKIASPTISPTKPTPPEDKKPMSVIQKAKSNKLVIVLTSLAFSFAILGTVVLVLLFTVFKK